MSVFSSEINIKTNGEVDIIDITDDIQNIVNKSKISNGIGCIFVPGSTGAITTIEYEPGLVKDLPRAFQKIAPKGEHYDHHETWHDDNGHSAQEYLTLILYIGILLHLHMAKRKYNYEHYLSSSEKLKNFLEKYKNRQATHRAYKTHLVKYFQTNNIQNIDEYIKDTRMMDKKEKIQYLDKLENDLTKYWIQINKEYTGRTPYVWLSAIKMFLIYNKTFELDNVYIELQKNGHGNYSITNTQTPTKKQLLKIFSYCNPESKALFMFQMTSGQRVGQVLQTTFDNIEMEYDYPRIYYPKAKQKYYVKTRITPEAKKILQEYLDQREKFINIRIKRGDHCRTKKLDMNKLFPMSKSTANTIWNTMVKNAGLYKLDPNTNKPVFGTHCLRRYFLSHFSDREWGDFFSGHITPRNKEYRQYSDEKLDEIYEKHMNDLNVFESQPDLTDINKKLQEKDTEIKNLIQQMHDIRMELLEIKLKQVQELQRKEQNK